jgi:hypothetical protein
MVEGAGTGFYMFGSVTREPEYTWAEAVVNAGPGKGQAGR